MSMGFDCSIPYGDNSRYDMIVDVGDELLRIQCKSASNPIKDGKRDLSAFQISTVTQTVNTKEIVRRRYTDEQIDYFATCYEDKVYIIPVEECSTAKTLRLAPPTVHVCTQCKSNTVSKENGICVECATFNARKVERPSREELKGLLRLKSFVEIGKDYGVSDNAVRRWCKSYNLPTKMSDIKSINPNDWTNL